MCIGPLKRACHFGPLIALSIIKAVTMATVACLSQWWPPWETVGGTVIFIMFMACAISTLYFLMHAMYTGPGTVPKQWKPQLESDCSFLQYCSTCEGFKAPRAHHCRTCGACNMKMDHHCPWINNCVGHKNHTSFTLFLFFAVVGCLQGAFILACSIYRAINRSYYLYYGSSDVPIVYMTLWGLVINMFVLGLALGVVIAVGMLLYFQMKGILKNRTAIEDWILAKAHFRREDEDEQFVYPYDLGKWNNFIEVINLSFDPKGDGIIWPVRDGCNQYTLTIEQITQKEEKRARSREFIITEKFSGWWFPCTKGVCTFLHPPCSTESRIQLDVGNSIIVTRWKRYWLYGERIPSDVETYSAKNRHRGWFPRRCAVEVFQQPEPRPSGDHSTTSVQNDSKKRKKVENKKDR